MHHEFTLFPVTSHTRHVGKGSTFVAIKGMKEDGIHYIPQALAAGATTIVVAQDAHIPDAIAQQIAAANAQLKRVPDTRLALAELSAQAHGYPAQKLKIIGVTGTKGKTTTSFALEHILRTAGFRTALLSTVKNKILMTDYPTELTTQQPDYLHAFLHRCVEQAVEYVIMEVAAQAVTLHRIATIHFDALLFLNFSREHGEFYETQDAYFAAKQALLAQVKPGAPILLNQDDDRVRALARHVPGVRFFSAEGVSQDSTLEGIMFGYEGIWYQCPALIGSFNVANLLAAVLCARTLGLYPDTIEPAIRSFTGVPGRLAKYVLPNGAVAFIDYAHNPASFERVLQTMREYTDHLMVVFGAGGDRDHQKRPEMGAVASHFADHVFVTSDNPRSEDLRSIIAMIMQGIPAHRQDAVTIEYDRAQAIHKAYAMSRQGSIIMLLGKGPDEYELVNGVKTYFSEREILENL